MGINIKSVQAYLIDLYFPFASKENFLKNKLDKEIDTSCEKIKKCSKYVTIFSRNLFLAWIMLKFVFLYFKKVLDN